MIHDLFVFRKACVISFLMIALGVYSNPSFANPIKGKFVSAQGSDTYCLKMIKYWMDYFLGSQMAYMLDRVNNVVLDQRS